MMPSLVCLFILVYSPVSVRHSRWHAGYPVQGAMRFNTVTYHFPRRGLECLYICGPNSRNWTARRYGVPRQQCCVKRSFMVIAPSDGVQDVNSVGTDMVLFTQMWSTVRKLGIPLDDLKRSVRLIALEAGMERTGPTPSCSRGGDWCRGLI